MRHVGTEQWLLDFRSIIGHRWLPDYLDTTWAIDRTDGRVDSMIEPDAVRRDDERVPQAASPPRTSIAGAESATGDFPHGSVIAGSTGKRSMELAP